MRAGARVLAGRAWRLVLVPALLYGAAFVALTWPWAAEFTTRLFADEGDGLQNYWNLWWIREAVTRLHTSPWWTPYLHAPFGVTLLGQTLNPFNGFAALLLPGASLLVAYNMLVTFSFVMAGVTAFWLAYDVSGEYGGALIAGYLFTFSGFHFAHAEGHMQLVSVEWLPLFLLGWLRLLRRPGAGVAAGTALALLLTLLCDYYYFTYGLLIAGCAFLWRTWRAGDWRWWWRPGARGPLALCAALVALGCGPLVGSLALLSLREPLVGVHNAEEFSLDLLGLVIPGGHWRFADLSAPFWTRLPGNIHESSVGIGLATLAVAGYAWAIRRGLGRPGAGFWALLAVGSALFALGPVIRIWGWALPIPSALTPYALLELVFPPFRVSGVPVRLVVVTLLATVLLAAWGWPALWRRGRGGRWLAGGLLVLALIETVPGPLPATRLAIPPWVAALAALPGDGAAVDLASDQYRALLYQTVHRRPLAFGYVSRIPESLDRRNAPIAALADARDCAALGRDYGFRFVVTPADAPCRDGALRYRDAGVLIFEVGVAP